MVNVKCCELQRNKVKEEYTEAISKAKSQKKRYKKLFSSFNHIQPKKLDQQFHALHETVFQEVDCLACANCCKTTSPIFYDRDIDRLAKHLKIKAIEFVETYLRIDQEGDHVLKSSPCPFLAEDNRCQVYESRPKACREYPHTNIKRMHQILDLTLKNSHVCPAVVKIVDKLKDRIN